MNKAPDRFKHKKESLPSKIRSRLLKSVRTDTAETAKYKEERYFATLAKELQDLPLEDHSNTADVSIWDFAGQYVFYDTHQVDGCDLSKDEVFKNGNIYLAPCFLKDAPPKDVIEQTDRKTTSKFCFMTASRFVPTAIFNKLLAAFIQILPISHHVTTDHKTQHRIYCGCGVFDVPNNHEMVVFFYENVIQIWLSKYSTSGEEPDNKTCFEQRQFVTTFLKRHLTTLKLFVKCPEASVYSDDMFAVETLQNQTEVVCGCQNRKHAVLTEYLTKYWCENKTEIKINLHSHRILNTIAQQIGKEYNALGLQLGFSQAEMDQVNIDRSSVADRTTAI